MSKKQRDLINSLKLELANAGRLLSEQNTVIREMCKKDDEATVLLASSQLRFNTIVAATTTSLMLQTDGLRRLLGIPTITSEDSKLAWSDVMAEVSDVLVQGGFGMMPIEEFMSGGTRLVTVPPNGSVTQTDQPTSPEASHETV